MHVCVWLDHNNILFFCPTLTLPYNPQSSSDGAGSLYVIATETPFASAR